MIRDHSRNLRHVEVSVTLDTIRVEYEMVVEFENELGRSLLWTEEWNHSEVVM